MPVVPVWISMLSRRATLAGNGCHGTNRRAPRMAANLSLAMAVLVAALAPTSGAEQQTLAVPAEVETVVTGGQWTSDKQSGTYRAIVSAGGFEHIVSQVQVDWIVDAGGRDNPTRVVSSRIAETASWRLFRPRIVKRSGKWRVLLDGIEPHLTPTPRGIWTIDLGEPGMLTAKLRCTRACTRQILSTRP